MTWSWNEIATSQLEGQILFTWSASGKARHVEFMIDSIDEAGITFRKQNGKLQRVSRDEAQNVMERWEQYKAGEIKRNALSPKNFCTSYLFGLLKRLETSETAI